MRPPIQFFVHGIPKPAGSKRGFYIERLKRVVITDACAKSRDWKTDVQHEAMRVRAPGPLWDCPIAVRFEFHVRRPDSHLGTGKNAGNIKASAPAYPAIRPDVLKLARAVEDALTGVIWKDDALIVDERITKCYGNLPGVQVEIRELEG